MDMKRLYSRDGTLPLEPGGSPSGSEIYGSVSEIASDFKTPILGDLRITDELVAWERDLSLLAGCGWVDACSYLVEKLIHFREVSPLDLVAVSAITEQVYLKPFVCSLALALRRLLERVILLDCDLRTPSLHTVTGSEGREGFVDMVKYGCSFSTVSAETEVPGIYVISGGSHPVTSEGELIGRELERISGSLRAKGDITLAIVPAFVAGRGVNPILDCVDGLILCVNRIGGRKSGMGRDFLKLWQNDIPILGVVSQEAVDLEARETVVLRASDETPVGERDSEVQVSRPAFVPEETVLPDASFLKKKSPPRLLWYGLGVFAVLVAVVVLVLGPRFLGRPEQEMDPGTLRAIVLPGSNGVVNADERSDEALEPPPGASEAPQSGVRASDGEQSPGREVQRGTANTPGGAGDLVTVASGAVYVQITSHREYESAREDSSRASEAGFKASIVFVDLGALGKWHRVLVGPFDTLEEAQVGAARMTSIGLTKEVRFLQQEERE